MAYQGKRAAGAVSRSGGVAAPTAPPKKKGKAGKVMIALVILFLLAVIGALVWFFVLHPATPEPPALVGDPNVKIGSAVKSEEERQAELNAMVAEGTLTFMINRQPMYSLSVPDQGCLWLIENPEENQNRFSVTVTRDDTNEVVYKSGYLDPGQYIDTAPLDVIPEKGAYECTAIFDTYSLEEDHHYIGHGGAAVTLYIVD